MIVVILCAAPTANAGPFDPPSHAEVKACAQRGGTYERRFQINVCIYPYSDGGKTCSDDSQCKGGCLADTRHMTHAPKRGERVTGLCRPTSDGFGCSTHVKNGRAQETMCIN
ncbi:MAG TPA: hypothetical protein VHL34_06540 [Rhizomicrobium sp.]|nr:hypothetical protein [Rhizomicrobium sp.]